MNNSSAHPSSSAPSSKATVRSLVETMRVWRDSFLDLVVLEAKKAGIGLALIFGFGVAATVLLITGWLALVGCMAAALVENDIMGWVGSLLLVALLNFAGAGGLVLLASKRKHDLLFNATRHQIGSMSVSKPGHVSDTPAELKIAEARVADSAKALVAQGQALKLKLRRRVTSPYVIGGVITAASAVAFFAIRGRAKPQDPYPRPKAHGNLASVLNTVQLILPLLGKLGKLGAATATRKRNQGVSARVLSQSHNTGHK